MLFLSSSEFFTPENFNRCSHTVKHIRQTLFSLQDQLTTGKCIKSLWVKSSSEVFRYTIRYKIGFASYHKVIGKYISNLFCNITALYK